MIGLQMKWVIVFVHMLGNPSYWTTHEFDTRSECEAKALSLDKRPVPQWYHACVRVP